VQPRKNQLLLLEAANQLRLPVVLLGPVLPGERPYGERVGAAANINQAHGGRWMQHLRNEDPLLASAYAACRLFVLLSSAETQPLSVMQAMAAQRPVLLLQAPYARDALFGDLPVAASAEPSVVVEALKRSWEGGQGTKLSREYTWLEVARQLQAIYSKVITG
jgi:glycosyltransferase involved in cell wall biosynthesis